MRILICAVLLLVMCLVPAGSVPETPAHPPGNGETASARVEFGRPPFFDEREYSHIPGPDKSFGPDMVIIVEANCDPDMLIPVEADYDPEFVIDRHIVYNFR